MNKKDVSDTPVPFIYKHIAILIAMALFVCAFTHVDWPQETNHQRNLADNTTYFKDKAGNCYASDATLLDYKLKKINWITTVPCEKVGS